MKYSPLFPISPEKSSLKNMNSIPLSPFGFRWISQNTGIFSLYIPGSEETILRLYSFDDLSTPFFCCRQSTQQDIVSITLSELPPRFAYSWQIKRRGQLCPEFADPWNPLLAGSHLWKGACIDDRSLVCQSHTSLPSAYSPNPTPNDLRLYECHVRAASQARTDPSTAGFYEGLLPLLDHVNSLGFNAIELLPVQEFKEKNISLKQAELVNYWGYMPLHPQTLMRGYSAKGQSLEAEKAFALFVSHAHKRDMRVILDLVFNHLDKDCPMAHCLGNELWLTDTEGKPVDYTGCGNTVNCQHPVVYEWIRFQLYYWVFHLGVDGFRFDLACALYRQTTGQYNFEGSLLCKLRQDPWLKDRIWINEPWDAAGAWDLGTAAKWGFFEWNDRYRDDARSYIHFAQRKDLAATRLCGSSDLFPQRGNSLGGPVQYITCHDGFCLRDLVTYNQRHNLANGEENRDGHRHNISFNYGKEGPSHQKEIESLRLQQICNFMTFLAVSKGPIMLLAGDEYGHTRQGNNNPWCQDNELNALDWEQIKKTPPMLEHLKILMKWRSRFSLFSTKEPWDKDHVFWHGTKLNEPFWENPQGPLSLELRSSSERVFIIFNPTDQNLNFELPGDCPWHLIVRSGSASFERSQAYLASKTSLLLSNTPLL